MNPDITLVIWNYAPLRPKNRKPLPLHRQEGLRTRIPHRRPKNQLRAQLPLRANAPRAPHLLVNQRIVVLQAAAETFGLERGPDGELVHGVAVARPDGEAVCVEGELFLHASDRRPIRKEQNLL